MKKTLHYLSVQTLFQYILPLTCFAFALVTQRYNVETDGAFARMYGFPFPFITETWSMTFHHSVYLVPAFVDFFLYLMVAMALVVSVQSVGVPLKSHWFAMILVWIAVGILYAFQFLLFADYNTYTLLYDKDFTVAGTSIEVGPYPTE
jgi:hypothetical protein